MDSHAQNSYEQENYCISFPAIPVGIDMSSFSVYIHNSNESIHIFYTAFCNVINKN